MKFSTCGVMLTLQKFWLLEHLRFQIFRFRMPNLCQQVQTLFPSQVFILLDVPKTLSFSFNIYFGIISDVEKIARMKQRISTGCQLLTCPSLSPAHFFLPLGRMSQRHSIQMTIIPFCSSCFTGFILPQWPLLFCPFYIFFFLLLRTRNALQVLPWG